jgi:hypothetical protein
MSNNTNTSNLGSTSKDDEKTPIKLSRIRDIEEIEKMFRTKLMEIGPGKLAQVIKKIDGMDIEKQKGQLDGEIK